MSEHHPNSMQATPDSDGRKRILMAAYPLFVDHGFKSVSMQQIADATGIHKATLYHHFLHKEALFTAVVQIALDQISSEVSHITEEGGSAASQLVQVACRIFSGTQSDLGRLMTDFREHISPEQREQLKRERTFPWDQFEHIFASAIASGELPADVDLELAVSTFMGMVWGQVWVRHLDRVTSPLNEQLAQNVVDILFAGLRAHASAPASGVTAG